MLDIRFPEWIATDNGTGNMLLLSVYDGHFMCKIRSREKGSKPFFFKRISIYQSQFFQKVIDKIIQASPETKIPIKFTQFDKNNKQWRLEWVFTFEKDSKMCYRLHITDVNNNQTHVFAIRGPQSISVGADVMSDADRSTAMLCDLKSWFESGRFWAPGTIQPFDPNKKKFGGGGNWKPNGGNGGGFNRGGNGGGYGNQTNNRPNNGNNGGFNGGSSNATGDSAGDPDGLPF